MHLPRRAVLSGLASLAVAGLPYRASGREAAGYGPLKPDPAGLFDLPEGFAYTVVSRAGEPMSDGFITPHKLDGMGCFALDERRVALVRNHELKTGEQDLERSPFGPGRSLASKIAADRIYDRTPDGLPTAGGTTTLVYDLKARRLEADYLSLAGTLVNCAGGTTPGGSWLSCEETVLAPGPYAGKPHGWVFEVPARLRGLADPFPITAMGRFKHEATATDPRTGIVYLTEDAADSLFYRYLPDDPARLIAGGRLQALGLRGGADTRNWDGAAWRQGDWREAVWIDLAGVDNPHDDLRLRGAAAGAAVFARGEGIHFADGELFFTCTSGGPRRYGQIMRYRPGDGAAPDRLQLFLEPSDRTALEMPDNIIVAPWGDLIVCEDKSERGVNHLRGVTPDGRLYTLARNAAVTADGENSELAGACFSPDGSTLFVNVYFPGMTLAITGPWQAAG